MLMASPKVTRMRWLCTPRSVSHSTKPELPLAFADPHAALGNPLDLHDGAVVADIATLPPKLACVRANSRTRPPTASACRATPRSDPLDLHLVPPQCTG